MDDSIWRFLGAIFVAVSFVLVGLRRRSSGVRKSSNRPNSQTPMSMRRDSLGLSCSYCCPHDSARTAALG